MSESHRILIDATEDKLLELTEEQLTAYIHGAEITTKIHRRRRQIRIRSPAKHSKQQITQLQL
jgi:hypothetical protein